MLDSMNAMHELDTSLSAMNDNELSTWLKAKRDSELPVVVAFQDYLCKVGELNDPNKHLVAIDPGKKAYREIERLDSAGLLSIADFANGLSEANSFEGLKFSKGGRKRLAELVDERKCLLDPAKTRGSSLSQAGVLQVWSESGGRCMFEGCACDLGHIKLHTKAAQAAYLAHIVASHPNGPRADHELSHQLANCPSNIMLMCDAHHRLIDRIAPETFTVPKLREMRKNHVDKTRRLLDSLSYKPAVGVAIFSDLAGVASSYSQPDLLDAAIHEQLNLDPTIHSFLNRTSRDDRDREGFWSHYLHDVESQIRELASSVRNGNRLSSGATLAVFPLHHVPILVLSGRILGEARPIDVFQYHRDLRTWRWQPDDGFATSKFSSNLGEKQTRAKEVLVSVELTAALDREALPGVLRERVISGEVRHIRLLANHPSAACIRSKSDLEAFSQQARKAINAAHDEFRADTVHFIGIAPVSALFKVGQMLQPGHHPEYLIYDRPKHDAEFQPALRICGNYVSEVNATSGLKIDLR